MTAKACVDLVAVADEASPTSLRCSSCERWVADYGGKLEHRRGGDQNARGGPAPQRPKRLSRAEVVSMLPERMDEVERHLASLLASQAALSVQVLDLGAEIRAWTARQPIYVEMRPRHQRQADGGEGGLREGKRLRRLGPGAA